ncbi:MAG: CaiB/BaiF CoA transferase family protein [Paracoccaceae bacterium]
MTQPLKGLRVLELARVLAGPWAGQTLADLGAEVVKVESPSGDETRGWGPPFHKDGSAAYFHSTNRGKKSIVADFRNNADLALVKKLAYKADILIENFKVGGLKKYCLDYESLNQINPKLIYCSITGFGQNGPYSNRPGYDFIIQAMGGIMDLTGEKDGLPQKPGIAYADIFTGLYSVIAIMSGLKALDQTGKGTHIDMALFDTQLGVLANQASSYFSTGDIPTRMGNAHPVIVPYQVFEVKDGALVIACGNDNQFVRMCEALNLKLHLQDEFKENHLRVKNRLTLLPKIEFSLKGLTKREVLDKLQKAGVPAGPINNVGEALNDKQSLFREMKKEHGKSFYLNNPIKFNNLELANNSSAQKLDADKKEITEKSFWEDH